jgi:hypothetical protein
MHFALSLTVLAIFRWSRRHPKSEASDKVCLEVLKINIESVDPSASLSTLVAQLQSRSEAYKGAFLNTNSSGSWKQNLAALVSRNVTGKENQVVGSVLSESAAVILEALNETIDELERV